MKRPTKKNCYQSVWSAVRLFSALSISIFILCIQAFAQETPADNWSQFRGNHHLTGVSLANVPASLKVLWTFEAGDSIESSAAVVGGTVFVGTQKGELVALNLDNGQVYWRFNTGAPIGESSPAYSNGAVFIGDSAGWLNALNASNGQKYWAFKTGTEIKSSPVVVGDRVLIGSYDQYLYCLSTRNGEVLWKFKTNAQVHATPSVAGGLVFLAGCDGLFRAIRLADGKEEFRLPFDAYTAASPALRNSGAFFGTFDNEVLGVNLQNRSIGWRYTNSERQFPFYSSAAVTSSQVVFGGRDKMVHGLSMTGKLLWTFATRARVESSPAIASGRVYVGSNDGRFYVLNLENGARVWEFNAGAPLSASPAIGRGRVVIGSQDGRLYCFG